MNDTLVLSRRPRIDRTDRWLAALAVVVFAAIVGIFTPVLASPDRVGKLTITNSGTWPVNVSIDSSDGSDWLPLGTAGPGATTVPDVIDPGEVWIVRFSNGEYSYNEEVRRSDIEAHQWTIEVPSQIQDLVKSSGADAPPTS